MSKNVNTRQDNTVRLIPLGGVGQFGMNCMVLEQGDTRFIIDCGVQFPDTEHLGIDLLIPDFSYITADPERVKAILITHGHEDHIGGLPFLIRAIGPRPIYGTAYTLALIARRLREHGLHKQASLHEIKAGEPFLVAGLDVEPIQVNHSVPDAVSLALRTRAGLIIHTGDWRLDQTPIGEPVMDLGRFAALGREGVLALVGDSTNVDREGVNTSETKVARELEDILDLAPGRVIITLFASNVWRIQSLLNAAHAMGRKVAVLGRSTQQHLETAIELGYIDLPDRDILIDVTETERYNDEEVAIIVSGSQGQARSSLTRVAMGNHRLLSIKKGDWVLYSSRFIPGNERPIFRVINRLYQRGAEVFTVRDRPSIHCSGHATREEMKLLINLTQPRFLIPVHGEYQQLVKHAALGRELGVHKAAVFTDGDVIELSHDDVRCVDAAPVGHVYVDGKSVGDVEEPVLRDRHKLASTGLIIVYVVLEASSGEVLSGPELLTRGFTTDDAEGEALIESGRDAARTAIYELNKESRSDTEVVAEAVRVSLRRFFNRKVRRKPVIIPIVNEM